MTFMKEITVECTECGMWDKVDDANEEFEKIYELEKCPKCVRGEK